MLLEQLACGPLNHLLRGESWALRRLAPHAGKTIRLDLPPLPWQMTIGDDGELRAAAPGAPADLRLSLTPATALRVLARDENAMREIVMEGDAELAQAVEFVARNLRWDAEEDLARVFGDVAAHRMHETGRALLGAVADGGERFARNLAEYWTEERPLLARRADVERFLVEVDTLRDDVERIEARISALASHARSNGA